MISPQRLQDIQDTNQRETNEFKKHKQSKSIFNLSFHKLNTEKAFSKLARNYYNLTDII